MKRAIFIFALSVFWLSCKSQVLIGWTRLGVLIVSDKYKSEIIWDTSTCIITHHLTGADLILAYHFRGDTCWKQIVYTPKVDMNSTFKFFNDKFVRESASKWIDYEGNLIYEWDVDYENNIRGRDDFYIKITKYK